VQGFGRRNTHARANDELFGDGVEDH